jgi:triacylglycerol lipase
MSGRGEPKEASTHLVLVPGFFGFVNFGRLVYFAHVREFLAHEFERRGLDITIHRARTHPVASLRERAADLRDFIAGLPPGPVHLVGHSSGGLDARLMMSPGADLGSGEVEPHAARVCGVTTICTPHRGSPLSNHLVGMIGAPLLRTFSILTVLMLREGRLPARLSLRFARALIGERLLPDTPVHVVLETLEQEVAQALEQNTVPHDRLTLEAFMHQVRATPHLITQLMPETLDLFNALVHDRPGVDYSCVIARSPSPSLSSQWRTQSRPYEQATHFFYQWLYRRTGEFSTEFSIRYSAEQREVMREAWGELPGIEDNDGLVPTASQVHGRILHAATADHLDVIGHLYDPEHVGQHHDLIASGSGFGRGRFEALWKDVASAICEDLDHS